MIVPRSAASIVLIRDAKSANATHLEVLMMQRSAKADFVAGAFVFPGGKVDPADALDPELVRGFSNTVAGSSQRTSTADAAGSSAAHPALAALPAQGLSHVVAAIRECFEEAGILLAYRSDGQRLDHHTAAEAARFHELRERLCADEIGFDQLLRDEGLVLAADRIFPWSHWITPEGQPIRFDTFFFLAHAPQQPALHDNREITQAVWVRPAEALELADGKRWMMILPTRSNLQSLLGFSTADEAIASAAGRTVTAMLPRVTADADPRIVLPGEPGYETALRDTAGVDPAVWQRARVGLGRSP